MGNRRARFSEATAGELGDKGEIAELRRVIEPGAVATGSRIQLEWRHPVAIVSGSVFSGNSEYF